MIDPSSAFTLGNRKYARTATGQNFSFGDEEDRNLREIVRQSGTSVSNLSNVEYSAPTYAEMPSMGGWGEGGFTGPPAMTQSVGPRDFVGGSTHPTPEKLNTYRSRAQQRSANKPKGITAEIYDQIMKDG